MFYIFASLLGFSRVTKSKKTLGIVKCNEKSLKYTYINMFVFMNVVYLENIILFNIISTSIPK